MDPGLSLELREMRPRAPGMPVEPDAAASCRNLTFRTAHVRNTFEDGLVRVPGAAPAARHATVTECSITFRKGEKNVKRFALLVLILAACGDNGVATAMSQCDVTLTLVPSTIGSVSSPSGSGSGSGTGDTRQAALDQAYRAACSQLGLDNATRSACEQGQDFQVEGGSQGNIRLFSAVERSIRCSSSSES